MPIMHGIKAYLYENSLTDNPNDYIARVATERSLSIADICGSAASRGGADISAAAIEHGARLFFKEMVYQICDGYSINAEYFTAACQIKGVFNSPSESFNPKKHTIAFQFHQGAAMRSELENISVNIMGVAETGISIAQVIDIKSGSVNEYVTPGRNLRIKGSKLKIAGTHEAVGIYLVHTASGQRFKVDASDIVTNNPSEMMIIVPTLEGGQYTLEITTQYAAGSLLKEPRSAAFDRILSSL